MKRIILPFFVISFWFFVVPAQVPVLAATLSLDPSSGTFNKGCPFSIKVNLDTGGAQTDGTDAIIIYDSSKFSINSGAILPNTSIYPDFPGNNVDEASGRITISGLASVATPFSGQGILATLNFTVKETAPTGATQMTFDFDPNNKANTRDSNVVERTTIADLLSSVVNGNYTVGTGVCGQAVTSPGTQKGAPIVVATPAAQQKTIDDFIDQTGKGPGAPQLTFAIAIVGGVLTVLGILGLALL